MSLRFVSLQTASESDRKVSIELTDRAPEHAFLLGNLPHNTRFRRADLLQFARDIIAELGEKGERA